MLYEFYRLSLDAMVSVIDAVYVLKMPETIRWPHIHTSIKLSINVIFNQKIKTGKSHLTSGVL